MAHDGIDFVLAAYREEGSWQVQSLPSRVADDLDALVTALRPLPSESGSIGMVSIDEDFFVLVRVLGPQVQLLLSDVTAATDWPLASEVVDRLELPEPDDERADRDVPRCQRLSGHGERVGHRRVPRAGRTRGRDQTLAPSTAPSKVAPNPNRCATSDSISSG